VTKSMSIHREHCELLGEGVHTPSIAAARVKPIIGAQQYNEARRCHRIAGIAKHSWCGLGNDRRKQSWADMVDEARFDSDASTAVPSEGIELDPVFVNDPWRHACTCGPLCSISSDAALPAPASLPSVGVVDCLPVPGVIATPSKASLDAADQASFFSQAILSLQKGVADSNALVKQLEARIDLLTSNCKEQHALMCSLSGHIQCLRQEQRSAEVHTACSPVSESPVRYSDSARRVLDVWKDSCLKDVHALILEHLNQAKSDAHLLLSESLERGCEQTMMLARTVAAESSGVMETAMGKLSGLFNDKIAFVVKRVAKLESKFVQPRAADCPDVCNSDTLPSSAASLRGLVDGMTKDVLTGDLSRARAECVIDASGMNDPSPPGDEVKPLVPTLPATCAEPVPGVPTLENSSMAFDAEMEQLMNLKLKNVHEEIKLIRGTVSQLEGALKSTQALANKAAYVSSQCQSFDKNELLAKVDQILGEMKAETVELSADLSSTVSAAASAAASSSVAATLDLKLSAIHTCVRAQLEENARSVDDKIAAHVCSATTEVAELRTKNDYLEKLLKDLQAQLKNMQHTLTERNLVNLGMETANCHISSDSVTTACGKQWEDTPLDNPAWERAPTDPQLDSTVLLHGLRNEKYNHLFAIVIGTDPERLHVRISPYVAIKVKRCNAMYPAFCPKCGNGVSSSMCFGCGYDPDPPGPRDPHYDFALQSYLAGCSPQQREIHERGSGYDNCSAPEGTLHSAASRSKRFPNDTLPCQTAASCSSNHFSNAHDGLNSSLSA